MFELSSRATVGVLLMVIVGFVGIDYLVDDITYNLILSILLVLLAVAIEGGMLFLNKE